MGPAFTRPRRSLARLGSPKARACTQEMQPRRLGPRAEMEPVCPGCSRHRPDSPTRYRCPRASKIFTAFSSCWPPFCYVLSLSSRSPTPNSSLTFSRILCSSHSPRGFLLSQFGCIIAASKLATLHPSPRLPYFFLLRLLLSLGLFVCGSSF